VGGKKKYLTDLQGDQAIQFIQGSVQQEPFCLSLSLVLLMQMMILKNNIFGLLPWTPCMLQ
jgi:hypothetical protein